MSGPLFDRRPRRRTRPPMLRATFDDELVVDNFAGGGGASTGIESALGRPVDIAINHDPEAIAMHAANHPETTHLCESVWKVDPRVACGGRPVGLAWFSPDCCHFSRAKGTTPVKKEIRGLAWVVIRWAQTVRPRVIVLENVEEFATWGPVVDGRPCPIRKGETFRYWRAKLEALGYVVESRSLVAADYGAPTIRKRLYLVARCDGEPIVWPEKTHGPGRSSPWRTAAECIDWSIPCPSIFERTRPLAEATLRRIAAGIKRYVLDAASPFLVPLTHQGGDRAHPIDEPMRTVTAAHRGELGLVAPSLIQTGYGERPGQAPRALDLHAPLGTLVNGQKHALVAAFITRHFGGMVGSELARPLHTVTSVDHHSLTAAFLTKFYGTSTGSQADAPMPTVTGQGHHFAEVRAFLVSYYGTGTGQDCRDPLRTVTSHDRFGLVTVGGVDYQIADIGMRMLQPRELFRAQGFPDSTRIDDLGDRRLTKTAQIRLAGNSVAPPVAQAIVAANFERERAGRRVA